MSKLGTYCFNEHGRDPACQKEGETQCTECAQEEKEETEKELIVTFQNPISTKNYDYWERKGENGVYASVNKRFHFLSKEEKKKITNEIKEKAKGIAEQNNRKLKNEQLVPTSYGNNYCTVCLTYVLKKEKPTQQLSTHPS